MSELIVQKSPFIFVCMFSYLLPTDYFGLDYLQFLQGMLKMLIFGYIIWNNLVQPLKVDNNEYTFGLFASKSKIFEISIKIDMEYFRYISMSQTIVYMFSLLSRFNLDELAFLQIMLHHYLSILQDLKYQYTQTQLLGFWRIPTERVLSLWIQNELD